MDKQEYRRQNEQRDKKKDANSFHNRWFGWWKTPSDRFAALMALFTAVLAGVACFQLSAMRSTDQATHTLAEAGLKQAEAALQALRPYMSYKLSLRRLDDFSQPIAPDDIPAAVLLDVEFTNHGSMAAKVADVRLKISNRQASHTPRIR